MRCDKCGDNNRDGAAFCSSCGNKLERLCSSCNHTLSPTAKFCDNCGQATSSSSKAAFFSEPVSVEQTQTTEPVKDHEDNGAERRHLTVVFCDLVGSTALSEQIDPEDMRNILADYQQMCRTIVQKYDGVIARYIGDGILIYFGYPVAYEYAVELALYASLDIAEQIADLDVAKDLEGVNLQVRIGINTGHVVVGDIGSGEVREQMAVVGDVPNVAARLQSLAQPGEIMLSARTHDLAGPMFEFADQGQQALKGVSQAQQVYRLSGMRSTVSQFESEAYAKNAEVIGRHAELSLLEDRLSRAVEGDGQVVLIAGEAGIGKSTVVRGFRDRLDDQYTTQSFYCSAHYRNSTLFPLMNFFEREIEFLDGDNNDTRLDKLGAWLRETDQLHARRDYAFLLQLDIPAETNGVDIAPQQSKNNLFLVLLEFFRRQAQRKPLILIVEDFHWCDPSTTDFLSLWIEQIESVHSLTLVTYREEIEPPWRHANTLSKLQINRLSVKETTAILNGLTGGKTLPQEVLQQIIAKTDGVPLFIEELTKMVIETDLLEDNGDHFLLNGPLPALAIPESLHDSLMARLDRLSTVKELVQLAAVLGRNFGHRLLRAASGLSEEDFNTAIGKLLDAELIFKSGIPPNVNYEFKHALVQETSYRNLLKNARIRNHRRFALLLADEFQEMAETQPELLAHHYTEANMLEEAVAYWQQAGNKAIARSANIEAIGHLRKGLSVNESMSDSPERSEQELRLQIALAVPLTAAHGYASSEVKDTYTRARALSKKVGRMDLLFPSLYGMWRFYLLSGQFLQAETLSRELVLLARENERKSFIVASYRAAGSTQCYMGSLKASREVLNKAIETDLSSEQRTEALLYDVVDANIASQSYQAWNLWLLGFPDQAQRQAEQAIESAAELNHLFTLTLAECFASWTFQFCGDRERTLELAKQSARTCDEYGFTFWAGWAGIMQYWSDDSFASQETLENIEHSLEDWLATGSRLGQTYFLQLAAVARADCNDFDSALQILDDAEAFAESARETWWQSELSRIRGELLLKQGQESVANIERLFNTALAIAGEQEALSLQLRAATSLFRLQLQQDNADKLNDAKMLLQNLYDSFTEGFDTSDLIEARELLSQN